jgi:hypothetical protein
MARIALTEQDQQSIAEILADVEMQASELLSEEEEETLEPADWDFFLLHVRQKVRSALEIGLIARAVGHAAHDRDLCDERGLDHFLRSKAWVHNFGVTQTADEYLLALSAKSGGRLVRCVDALVEIAQDRMFGTLDEEYQRLFPAGN